MLMEWQKADAQKPNHEHTYTPLSRSGARELAYFHEIQELLQSSATFRVMLRLFSPQYFQFMFYLSQLWIAVSVVLLLWLRDEL